MMQDTHNVIGTPRSVSGADFLSTAVDQLRSYGADYRREFVTGIERVDDSFALETTDGGSAVAERVVPRDWLTDERPEPPLPRTGRGLHYCLHCDAYMFVGESVYVMGHSESAAHVAMIMLNFTDDVDLLLRGDEPTWSDETATLLEGHPVDIVHEDVTGVRNGDDGWLEALEFADGTVREYRGGFAMYGSEYNNGLAASLGADLNDDGTVAVDDHGRTSVDGLSAVGDLTPGHNQIPVAMGQGAKAGARDSQGAPHVPEVPRRTRGGGPRLDERRADDGRRSGNGDERAGLDRGRLTEPRRRCGSRLESGIGCVRPVDIIGRSFGRNVVLGDISETIVVTESQCVPDRTTALRSVYKSFQ